MIDNAADCEEYAMAVEDTNGVYVVPAFVGLGALYWDHYARGTIVGHKRSKERTFDKSNFRSTCISNK